MDRLLVCIDISSSDSDPVLGDMGWLGGGRGTGRAITLINRHHSSYVILRRLTIGVLRWRTFNRYGWGSTSTLSRRRRNGTI